MIDRLKNKHFGASIAVLGSAPSVKLFKVLEDVVIGVNGAGTMLKVGDYFLSSDQCAHSKSWFLDLDKKMTCILRAVSAIYSDRFYSDQTVRGNLIGVYEQYMRKHPECVSYLGNHPYLAVGKTPWLVDFGKSLPEPKEPNLILRYLSKNEKISREQKVLNSGATSAGLALQLANVMGASEIHLYGVEFSNFSEDLNGNNYFYTSKQGETGKTTKEQRIRMDEIIENLIQSGVPVYSHGYTLLQNSIKI